jgi:hypothetical protein
MKTTTLIAATCTLVAAGTLCTTAEAAETTQVKATQSLRTVHRAGPRSTIVMPAQKTDDEALVAATVGEDE